jgi:2-polyprenyl-3-methyl-5-hydroxy-6-metoxy-1,4-benzoquinol methylase
VPTSRYSCSIDLSNLNTSHALAILSVPAGSAVLDIGAADGSVARLLADRGCRVWAIEVDERAAREAATACELVVTGDVERLDLAEALDGARFDVVLLLDVLEHLRDPGSVLKRAAQLLSPGGQIIASIPNVTHGAVRLSLLRGTFTYSDSGLLDRTHLRFFDRQGVEALFGDAGLDIRDRLRVTRGLAETEIAIDQSSFPPSVIAEIERDPDSTTFQFVIVAAPREAASPAASASDALAPRGDRRDQALDRVSLGERLLQELDAVRVRLREAEAYARSLELKQCDRPDVSEQVESLSRQVGELTGALAERMGELQVKERDLRYLKADLAVKEAFATELRQSLLEQEDAAREINEALRRHEESRAVDARRRKAEDEAAASRLRETASELQATAARLREARLQHEHDAQELAKARIALSAPSIRRVTRISAWLRRFPRLRSLLRRGFSGMFLRE